MVYRNPKNSDPADAIDETPDVDSDRHRDFPTEEEQWEGTPHGEDIPRPSADGDADADMDERDAGVDHDRA